MESACFCAINSSFALWRSFTLSTSLLISGSFVYFSVHFVLSNNLPSFIWLHWIEASSCSYMVILKVVQNPWTMSKIATKWKWQATIKCGTLAMLRRCNDVLSSPLPSLSLPCVCHRLHFRLVHVQKCVFIKLVLSSTSIHSIHVHKCRDEVKASAVKYKWKKVRKESTKRKQEQSWMCKLHELQTMQL